MGKPWLTRNNPTIDFRTNEITINGRDLPHTPVNSVEEDGPPTENMFISGGQARHALRAGGKAYIPWVATVPDGDEAPSDCSNPDVSRLLMDFSDVFPEELPDELPPERPVDHDIRLEQDSSPPSRPAYRLPKPEMDELKQQLEQLLVKGFVVPSKSLFGAPVFFVKKADSSLRMVCDWRDLNKITIKNKACLPNTDDLFDTVQGSTYFTKFDLRSGYNQIRIQNEDIEKTAINTPYGHYEFRVMGFGLTNAQATFQTLMNSILRTYLRDFVVVFLDDILIFSRTWSDHLDHVRAVLETFRENKLFCKRSKCEFGVRDVLFQGHRIDGMHISPDPKKLQAVAEWPTPTSITEVRQFLGFTYYFRRFVDHYSSIAKPLEEITGKNAQFSWNSNRQDAFVALRRALVTTPVLKIPDVSRPFRVVTDASDFAIAGVLLQQDLDQAWHAVAYNSRT